MNGIWRLRQATSLCSSKTDTCIVRQWPDGVSLDLRDPEGVIQRTVHFTNEDARQLGWMLYQFGRGNCRADLAQDTE
jgi:hypothetical protein